jgi:hypothetical protein
VGEVVAGGRPEAGNRIAGLSFLAGSTVRGALAGRWRGDRAGDAFRRCFLSGRVRFGFLYPPSGQAMSHPVPRSVYTCKNFPGPLARFGHGFMDLLLDPEAERCPQGCGGRLIPWGPRFEGPAGAVDERLALSPHNRVDPWSQTVGENALFAYEALPEGTRLRGFIEAESEEDVALLLSGLSLAAGESFSLRVGRRKGALGHLDCRLSPYAGRPGGVGLFPDEEPLPRAWTASAWLRIDLLTPAIVVDERLRFRESLSPRDLGLSRERFDEALSVSEILSGWNTQHRLPKPDELAVAAGSSYLLARPAQGAEEELASLARAARSGIGLRREEGFGVIAVSAVDAGALRRPEP